MGAPRMMKRPRTSPIAPPVRNKEFLFSQSNNDRQLLNMVDGALARIREGSFGECVSCGKEINAKRLEAVPWTRHCIECQEKAEQGLLEAAQ